MTLHKIKLKELNNHYIQQLQSMYANKDIDVEIWVVDQLQEVEMTESLFWHIITLLDWEKQGNDEAVLAPALQRLSQLSQKAITDFYDLLSEKLFHLDGQIYADHSTDEDYFSADLFLYARCAVVANGKDTYLQVLNNPAAFPKDVYFEALLNLPAKAWKKKMGEDLEHLPKYMYETGFNPSGWGEQTITL